MEEKSPREESVAKVRKPYTFTKQREKWTEEEHNRFLDALKLHGRAWQRIEEHIGTKTAVQIRSHAQKFFTKLERAALVKGVRPGQVHDIDIPPPRPKRKPSNPYPRKKTVGSISPSSEAAAADDKSPNSLSLQSTTQHVLCSESDTTATERFATTQAKEYSEDGSTSKVLNINRFALSASTSLNRGSSNHTLMEFLPAAESLKEKTAFDESLLPSEENNEAAEDVTAFANQGSEVIPIGCTSSHIKSAEEAGGNKSDDHAVKGILKRDTDGENTTPITGQQGVAAANSSMRSTTVPAPPNLQHIPAIASLHHKFPSFSPLAQCHSNQDISSTFSSLIISTLLRSPSVHTAASLAALVWPSTEVDGHFHPNPDVEGGRDGRSSPCMTSIVTATLAAATAWWAAQGNLPWLPPNFTPAYASTPRTTVPPAGMVQATQTHDGSSHGLPRGDQHVVNNPNISGVLKTQQSSAKSLSSQSSTDSDEKARGEESNCIQLKNAKGNRLQELVASGLHASRRKKKDRSCASIMSSSSDIANKIILEKHEKIDAKETYFSNCSPDETNNGNFRSRRSMDQSWKSVSQEVQPASEASPTREIMPQSNSSLHIEDAQTTEEKPMEVNENSGPSSSRKNCKYGTFKASQTVFKPYKRCSVEAKENKATAREETGNKKICLPEEA